MAQAVKMEGNPKSLSNHEIERRPTSTSRK